MTHLVDTNILSELCRPEPNSGVLKWARSSSRFTISAITREEIAFGLSAKPNARIEAWFEDFFESSCNILPVDEKVAVRAGRLRGELRRSGESRHSADMLIAATCLSHDLILVTRNTKDFERCGLTLLNPFT